MKIAIQVNDLDNVATIFAENAKENEGIEVQDKKGNRTALTLKNSIPYGHKIAIKNIPEGKVITKYGEAIGVATIPIKTGEHVHVHNLDSMRARGDLQDE